MFSNRGSNRGLGWLILRSAELPLLKSQVGWESSWGDDALSDLLSHFTGSGLIEHAYLTARAWGCACYTYRNWRYPSIQKTLCSKTQPEIKQGNGRVANVLHDDCAKNKVIISNCVPVEFGEFPESTSLGMRNTSTSESSKHSVKLHERQDGTWQEYRYRTHWIGII